MYSINTYKQNRNIKFVSVEAQEEREYSRENSHTPTSVNGHTSSNATSSTSNDTSVNSSSNDSHLSEDCLNDDDLSSSDSNNTNSSNSSSTNSSFNSTTTAEAISTYLFEEICSRICETTPTEYVSVSNSHMSGFSNANTNEYNLLENSCVKKYQRDDLNDSNTSTDDSDTSASITDLINNMYSSKTSFTEYYVIYEKHFSG